MNDATPEIEVSKTAAKLFYHEFFIDLMGGLVPGLLFLVSIAMSGLSCVYIVSNLTDAGAASEQTLLDFFSSFMAPFRQQSSAFWIVFFIGAVLLTYVIGHVFYRKGPKKPDKQSFIFMKNDYLKGVIVERLSIWTNFEKFLESFKEDHPKSLQKLTRSDIKTIRKQLLDTSKCVGLFFDATIRKFRECIDDEVVIEKFWKRFEEKFVAMDSNYDPSTLKKLLRILNWKMSLAGTRIAHFFSAMEKNDNELIGEHALQLRTAYGCATEEECEFPYPYYGKYLKQRGLKHLLPLVSWDDGDNTEDDWRSKNHINLLKTRLRFHHPDKCGMVIRNEAHVRLSSSAWYVCSWLTKINLLILLAILTALGTSVDFNPTQLFSIAAYAPLFPAMTIPVLMLFLCIYTKWSITKYMHYARMREVFHVLETAYTAFSSSPEKLEYPYSKVSKWRGNQYFLNSPP